ncbi:MAG TPA: hypothetical protein VFU15_01515 [Bacteroidia bacterium]|nr:hypothetical protein [Bacteroidia bacterium]
MEKEAPEGEEAESDEPVQLAKNKKRWTPQQREQSRKFWEKKGKKLDRRFVGDHITRTNEEKKNKEELPVIVKGDVSGHLNEALTLIVLQGSTTPGQHQDLICNLSSGANLRFSRNQSEDTAQYGAEEGRMPHIASYPPQGKQTVRSALIAFRQAHDDMRCYFNGDCQSFASKIVEKLAGTRTGYGASAEEESFM